MKATCVQTDRVSAACSKCGAWPAVVHIHGSLVLFWRIMLPDLLSDCDTPWAGPMNAKAKGNRNEHRSMALLEALGYRCSRSAASLGVFDICGIGINDVVLVQVKSNRNPPRAEMETLKSFQVPAGVKKLLHVWKDQQHEPVVTEIA